MISIVVPAHNEAAVIGRCLRMMLQDARPGELDIVVAANGCTDGTVEIARSFGPPVRIVDVAAASKTAALNAGEKVATGFPRIYVDADVEVDTQAIRDLAASLEGPIVAASPGLFVDTSESSALVRSYYRVWCQLPSVRDDLVGRGTYAVSEVGRQRFGVFPEVINDDHFFRTLFGAAERTVVHSCRSHVWAPRTLRSLINRKIRVYVGNQSEPRRGSPWAGLTAVLRNQPLRIIDAPAFVLVALLSRRQARRMRSRGRAIDWGRDDSRPTMQPENAVP